MRRRLLTAGERLLVRTYRDRYTGVYAGRVAYRWLPFLLARLAGVEGHEVMQVLEYGQRWARPVEGYGIRLLEMWGRTRDGRPLIVTLRRTDVAHDWLIVWAREMTAEQVAEFERWEAS